MKKLFLLFIFFFNFNTQCSLNGLYTFIAKVDFITGTLTGGLFTFIVSAFFNKIKKPATDEKLEHLIKLITSANQKIEDINGETAQKNMACTLRNLQEIQLIFNSHTPIIKHALESTAHASDEAKKQITKSTEKLKEDIESYEKLLQLATNKIHSNQLMVLLEAQHKELINLQNLLYSLRQDTRATNETISNLKTSIYSNIQRISDLIQSFESVKAIVKNNVTQYNNDAKKITEDIQSKYEKLYHVLKDRFYELEQAIKLIPIYPQAPIQKDSAAKEQAKQTPLTDEQRALKETKTENN